MSVDLSTNSQYTALQQQYDSQISSDTQIQDLYNQLKPLESAFATMGDSDPNREATQGQITNLLQQLNYLDPSGSVRSQMDAGKDPVADLQSQENTALGALATSLFQQ